MLLYQPCAPALVSPDWTVRSQDGRRSLRRGGWTSIIWAAFGTPLRSFLGATLPGSRIPFSDESISEIDCIDYRSLAVEIEGVDVLYKVMT
jgi:hypothetical protein